MKLLRSKISQVVIALAGVLWLVGTASASTVAIEGTTAVVRLDPGRDDDLQILYNLSPTGGGKPPAAVFRFASNNGGPELVSQAPCAFSQCAAEGLTGIEVFLGDGADLVAFGAAGWTPEPDDERIPFPIPVVVHGEAGNDTLGQRLFNPYPFPNGLTIDGGAGNDQLNPSTEASSVTTAIGGDGDDRLGGEDEEPVGEVHLFGGDGNDRIQDSLNVKDTIDAGAGNDLVLIPPSSGDVARSGPPASISCGDGVDRLVGESETRRVPASVVVPADCEEGPAGKTGAKPEPVEHEKFQIKDGDLVGPGTVVDATKRTVSIIVIAAGTPVKTDLFGGRFKVSQPGSVLRARLLGKPSCPKKAKTSGNRKRPRLAVTGAAEVVAKFATARSLATGKFLIEQRCEGTYVKGRSSASKVDVLTAKGKVVRSLADGKSYVRKKR